MALLYGCAVFIRHASRVVSKDGVLVFGNITPARILFNRKSSNDERGEANGNEDNFLGIPLSKLRTFNSFQGPNFTMEFEQECQGIRKFLSTVEPKDREELLVYTLANARLKNKDLMYNKEVLITAEILKSMLFDAALWKKKKFLKADILSEDDRLRLESFFEIRNDIVHEVEPHAQYTFDDTDYDVKVPEKYSWYYQKVKELIAFYNTEKQG